MNQIRVSAKSRQELINKSTSVTKGKQRFYRRLFSKIQIPNRGLQNVNVAKWFETDILDAQINVTGETKNYIVAITFYGIWESYDKTKALSPSNIRNAISLAFRSEDIYLHCGCPDFRYRYAYIATQQQYISEKPEYRPAHITNPQDSLGSACKHCLLVLMQSHIWIDQLSRITYQYIQRIQRSQPRLYDKFIKDKIEDEIADKSKQSNDEAIEETAIDEIPQEISNSKDQSGTSLTKGENV